MPKKTAPRKGTKTKRLTTPQRRVILANHGWVPTPPFPDVYWRGTPSMQRVRVKTGEVSDNGGETYTKVTDRDFRAFVRKYAPTARKGTTRKPAAATATPPATATGDTIHTVAWHGIQCDTESIKPSPLIDLTKLAADVATVSDRTAAMIKAFETGDFDTYSRENPPDKNSPRYIHWIVYNRLNGLAADVAAIKTRLDALDGRNADAATATVKPDLKVAATPEERAAMCEKWGMEEKSRGHTASAIGGYLRVFVASGYWCVEKVDGTNVVSGNTTTLAELEAVLRQHLPYDREWREKAAKAEGWSCNPGQFDMWWYPGKPNEPTAPIGGVCYPSRKNMYPTANTLHAFGNTDNGGPFNESADRHDLPDRAAWLAFLREHAVKRDPDATPEERRRECEARGLKAWYYQNGDRRYSRDGSRYGIPCAMDESGNVAKDPDGHLIKTRTLSEFRAALGAVGLVKVEYTEATRRAACEKRGWVLWRDITAGYTIPGSEEGHPFANVAGGWVIAALHSDSVDIASQAEWDAWLDRHTPGQWVVPAEDVAAIAVRLDAANKRIAALEDEKSRMVCTLENIRRALGGTNDA